MENKVENLIEAILFHKAESVSKKNLAKMTNVSLEEVEKALKVLESNLSNRGIVLVTNADKVMLRTSPEASEVIEQITKDDLSKDLGKAGLETLSIVLYNNPISGSDIEYIRGVKSSYALRSLLMRGLLERFQNPENARSYLYRPTFETLGFLGISDISELPEYEQTRKELEQFAKNKDKDDEGTE